jgi:hypothetical protein
MFVGKLRVWIVADFGSVEERVHFAHIAPENGNVNVGRGRGGMISFGLMKF